MVPFALLKDVRNSIKSVKSLHAIPAERLKRYKTTECHWMHRPHTRRRNKHRLKSSWLTWRSKCCKTAWMTYLNNGRRRAPNTTTIVRKISRALETNPVNSISKTTNKRAQIMVRSWRHIKCEQVKPAPSSHSLKCTKKRVPSQRLTAATASTTKVIHSVIKGPLQSLSLLFAKFSDSTLVDNLKPA